MKALMETIGWIWPLAIHIHNIHSMEGELSNTIKANLPFIKQYLNLIVLAGIGAAVVPLVLGGLWKLVRGKGRAPRAPADR